MNEKKKEKFVMHPADKAAMKKMLVKYAWITLLYYIIVIGIADVQMKLYGDGLSIFSFVYVSIVFSIIAYLFAILPCIVFRFRVYKKPCKKLMSFVVWFIMLVLFTIIEYVLSKLYGVEGAVYSYNQGLFYINAITYRPGFVIMIMQVKILKKNISHETDHELVEKELTLWAEIMDNLPLNLVWAEICNTDFGNLLERLHEKNKDTNEIKRDAVYITLSAALNTLKHRCNDNKQYNNKPQDSQLLSFADKQIKKAQKHQWLDDETVQKLSKALNYYQTKLKAKSTDL